VNRSSNKLSSSVRYGIAGLGVIAENRLIAEGFACGVPPPAGRSNIGLAGVTDRNQQRRKVADRLGVRWFGSLQDMLKSDEVDAVIIATDNASHASIARDVLEAGRHCLIEKPMATSLEEARLLRTLARDHGVSLAVDHVMEHNALNIMARTLIAEGRIGEVNDICLHMEMLYGTTPDQAASWRCSDASSLGGPTGDLGSHCFYMAEFLLRSRIASVSCVYYPKTLDIVVENGAYIKFETESGLTGSIRVAFSEPRGGLLTALSNLGYEAYGTEGVLRAYGTLFQLSGDESDPVGLRMEVEDANGVERIPAPGAGNIYQSAIRRHAESVLEARLEDGSAGIHNLQLILAAHDSAAHHGRTTWISRSSSKP
jgi:predicted dehydrogenase